MAVLIAIASGACEREPRILGFRCNAGQCPAGFSCLVNRCIADQTVEKGQTCNADQQCSSAPELLFCAPTLFTCRPRCAAADFFSATGACGSGEYCQPFRDENDLWVGVCVPSDDCQSDPDCGPGFACVTITSTASACLPQCQIDWFSGDYADNCGGTAIAPKYCQPMGAPAQERLTCLDTVLGADGAGAPCRPVDDPCTLGMACIDGICKTHCDPTGGGLQCDVGERCCARTTATAVYGICATTCS